ncbi:hypothetical protein WJX72_012565 [[Myrmecia] bisecta]|uniref:CWH43-like N-terminal domain-containing protein n=1 Tax=[Myrmecia] bisecta TaxID=41462 RepID=A0AAW1RAF6_9CHLO
MGGVTTETAAGKLAITDSAADLAFKAHLQEVGFGFAVATIVALLAIWLADGHPRYRSDEATVVYISDVGAANHALFIVLGTCTALCFFGCLFMDYRLRHTGRVPGRLRWWERAASALSVIFGFVCAVCCILLTIFDTFHHSRLHWTFAAIFFVCLLISGFFNMVESTGLYRDYRGDPLLQASFISKLVIVCLGIPAIVLMAVLGSLASDGSSLESAAAALEWFLVALFALYILSMALDLYPSRYTSKHVVQHEGVGNQVHPVHGVAPLHGSAPYDGTASPAGETEMAKKKGGARDQLPPV